VRERRLVCCAGITLLGASVALGADIGTAFTYQGFLERPAGTPVTDTCNFVFRLWDDPSGGVERGNSPQTVTGVGVVNGVFTVGPPDVDFGPQGFDGTARWLAIDVQCRADIAYVQLSPRQEMSPAPYALALPGLYTQQNATSPNVVGGRNENTVSPGATGATISGGGAPFPDINRVTDTFGTIGGGCTNRAGNDAGTVTDAQFATVGGGFTNTASGTYATAGGGVANAAIGNTSTVGGGFGNTASGFMSTVGGGQENTAGGLTSTIGGGAINTASGSRSTVPGGVLNLAGGDFSFAAGRRAKVRDSVGSSDANGDEGTFVWADATDADFQSTGPNQFLCRASRGTKFYSNADATIGVQVAAGGNSWSAISDRNVKQNVTPVDSRDVLERLAGIPIGEWNLISQDPSIRHIGPMAQDFHAAFRVGEMETHISSSDADGVALAAIQGLYEIAQEKDCELAELREQKDREVEELRSEISNLKAMVGKLAAQQNGGGQ